VLPEVAAAAAQRLATAARQETSQAVEGSGYRRLKPQRPDRRVTIDPLGRKLVSFLSQPRGELPPHLLASRLIGVGCRFA
jgi:hypothetical protein